MNPLASSPGATRIALLCAFLTTLATPTGLADPVAVSPDGSAEADLLAVSLTGDATCRETATAGSYLGCVALSGTGDATAHCAGQGDGVVWEGCAAISGLGSASCAWTSTPQWTPGPYSCAAVGYWSAEGTDLVVATSQGGTARSYDCHNGIFCVVYGNHATGGYTVIGTCYAGPADERWAPTLALAIGACGAEGDAAVSVWGPTDGRIVAVTVLDTASCTFDFCVAAAAQQAECTGTFCAAVGENASCTGALCVAVGVWRSCVWGLCAGPSDVTDLLP